MPNDIKSATYHASFTIKVHTDGGEARESTDVWKGYLATF
jgi:hypothetical protein